MRKHHVMITLLLVSALFGIDAAAQTVLWSVRPSSTALTSDGGMVKYRSGGKVGLKSLQGEEILAAQYDSITPFFDGYAVAMQQAADRMRIKLILRQGDNDVTEVAEELYATDYIFFSEGKMCVSNARRQQGFLGTDGNLAIPCIYRRVHPFCEGLASVTLDTKANKRNVYYINESMNEISVEPGYGEIIFGSSFSAGKAVVYTINRKGYVINNRGRKMGNYRPTVEDAYKMAKKTADYTIGTNILKKQDDAIPPDMGYTVYSEEGHYGYKKDGQVILPAQLERAEPFRGGYAVVTIGGHDGMLRLVEGSFAGQLEKKTLTVLGKKASEACYVLSLPSELSGSNLTLRVYNDKGEEVPCRATTTFGTTRTFSFTPRLDGTQQKATYHFAVSSDGLLLWRDKAQLDFLYMAKDDTSPHHSTSAGAVRKSASFMAYEPIALRKRADDNDNFPIAVQVFNRGDVNGVVNVALHIDGKKVDAQSVSVKAGSSIKATLTCKVTKERIAIVQAVLSSGKGSKKEMTLKPNY